MSNITFFDQNILKIDTREQLKEFVELFRAMNADASEKYDEAQKLKLTVALGELENELNELNAMKNAIVHTINSKIENTKCKIALLKSEVHKINEQ